MDTTEDNSANVEEDNVEESALGSPYVLTLCETEAGLSVEVAYDPENTSDVVVALGDMVHAIFMNRLNRIAEESMKEKEGAIYIPDAPKLIM